MLYSLFYSFCFVNISYIASIAGTAIALGGLGQILVAIFELIKGSSFSFAVFGCYGAFWLGWAITYIESNRSFSNLQDASYQTGSALWLGQWGVLTSCFWILTWRKNIALIIIFTLLSLAFWLLAAAAATGDATTRIVGGVFGLLTAIGAFYTGIAELINEEYGRHVLPGLRPLHDPSRLQLSSEYVMKLIDYDSRTNTLFLSFRGLRVKTLQHVDIIREAVEKAILDNSKTSKKVHVVADYQDTYIRDDVAKSYWNMASELERTYYLSATRFHVSSFGTMPTVPATATMRKANDTMDRYYRGSVVATNVPPSLVDAKHIYSGSLNQNNEQQQQQDEGEKKKDTTG